MPVQWRNYNLKLGRYQGTLLDKDKKTAQKAFAEKVKRAHSRGRTTAEEDRSGIEAIVERLLTGVRLSSAAFLGTPRYRRPDLRISQLS